MLFKRLIPRFLCIRADDLSSCEPVSIRRPAPGIDRKGRSVRTARIAKTCLNWLKCKIGFGTVNDEELLARFSPVCDRIDFDKLPEYLLSVRRLQCLDMNANKAAHIDCEIDMTPMVGQYHALFPVIFSDGVQWLLKVPAAGCAANWDSSAARSLRSEALTMKFIQSHTSIPVPKVYDFESTLDNPVGCPFILMERLGGRPLYEKWYDGFDSSATQECFRERVLESLATAMVQLLPFEFAQAGAPDFDEGDILRVTTPVRVFDAPAMHAKMFSGSYDNERAFCHIGPHNTAEAYFASQLDRHRPSPDNMGKAIPELLRLFIKWASQGAQAEEESFHLTHPDFNLQNVLVADDGTLQGLIDWDGVSTVPWSISCPFPKWLSLDWDPANYNYGVDEEDRCCGEVQHHSPSEMKHYRALYTRFVKESAAKAERGSKVSTVELARATQRSLLMQSLNQAAKDPLSTDATVVDLLDKIAHITSQDIHEIRRNGSQEVTYFDNVPPGVDTARHNMRENPLSSRISSEDTRSDQSDLSPVVSHDTKPTEDSGEDRKHSIGARSFVGSLTTGFHDGCPHTAIMAKKGRMRLLLARASRFVRANSDRSGNTDSQGEVQTAPVAQQQHCLSLNEAAPSGIQSESDLALHVDHEKQDSCDPASDTSLVSASHRKANIGQQIKAKLTFAGRDANQKPQAVAQKSSKDIKPGKWPARLSSGRKRITAWIRKTAKAPQEGNVNANSMFVHNTPLPQIPRVSYFDITDPAEVELRANTGTLRFTNSVHGGAEPDTSPLPGGVHGSLSTTSEDLAADLKLYKEGFQVYQICDAIVEGTMGDARMQRLRSGFAALLESL